MNEAKTAKQSLSKSAFVELLEHAERDDPTFWKERINTSLTIEQTKKAPISSASDSKQVATPSRRDLLAAQGYCLIDEKLDSDLVKRLKDGIEILQKQSLPATFILLFDETWQLARLSRNLMQKSCHPKNELNFDILAWYIASGESGFSPHRDRQPEEVADSFHGDFKTQCPEPKFITHWIALSEATPRNSCLFCIPREGDPGYHEGDTDEQDPLQRALHNKAAYQNIRAMPRESGQSLLFSHRLIHWGSKSELHHENPRIAISFVSSDPDYEAPLISRVLFTDERDPPFAVRLLLVCAQLIIYYQRFELNREEIEACYKYCKGMEEDLGKEYKEKVFVEFVKAMKETSGEQNDDNVKEPQDEEAYEDAMMEEMLQAEQEGYGSFEDDFDEAERNSNDDEEYADAAANDYSSSDEEEEVNIFGKRDLTIEDSEISKKVKKLIR